MVWRNDLYFKTCSRADILKMLGVEVSKYCLIYPDVIHVIRHRSRKSAVIILWEISASGGDSYPSVSAWHLIIVFLPVTFSQSSTYTVRFHRFQAFYCFDKHILLWDDLYKIFSKKNQETLWIVIIRTNFINFLRHIHNTYWE